MQPIEPRIRKRRAQLEAIAAQGVPREILIKHLVRAALDGGQRMTSMTRAKLRARKDELKRLASQVEKTTRQVRDCVESDPFGGIQKPSCEEYSESLDVEKACKVARERFVKRFTLAGLEAPKLPPLAEVVQKLKRPIEERLAERRVLPWWKVYHATELAAMESLAKSLKEESQALGRYLRRESQKVRGIHFVLGWILFCNPDFNQFAALSKLFDAVFPCASDELIESTRPDALRQAAKREIARRNSYGSTNIPNSSSGADARAIAAGAPHT